MNLLQILERKADLACKEIERQGYMTGGHNGPYFDEETPVRNTAHWLFTFSMLYRRTQNQKYKKAAEIAINYLLSPEARPMNAAFWIRKNPKKDFCNGVIGQAWVMESLILASRVFSREDCYSAAEEVFLLHEFDRQLYVWNRLNVDGSHASPDPTFNHQLWMCALASLLDQTPGAIECSKLFFENRAIKVKLYGDGIIQHVSPVVRFSHKIRNPKKIVEGVLGHGYYWVSRGKLRLKSSGYHAFNLYAFAILKDRFPEHAFWQSRKFKRMLKAVDSRKFQKEQIDNKYSYPYNPTGLEMAFVTETFDPENIERVEFWLKKQLEFTAEEGKSIMTKGTADENTARARIYEASRIKGDYHLS